MSSPPVAETVVLASELLSRPVRLVGVPLPSASRNLVLRVVQDDGQTLIVKRHLVPGPVSPSPEAAALRAFSHYDCDLVPRFIAGRAEVIVMADLGDHPNVAGRLLGTDPLAVRRAMLAWGGSLGTFHADSRRARSTFEHIMRYWEGGFVRHLQDELTAAADALPAQLADWGIDVPDFSALATLPDRLATDLEVLSPGDVCPDNNLLIGDRVTFIDLEFATVHHVAWDLAYLRVPWPSCWCAWQLPPGLADAALEQWRTSFGCSPREWRSLLADIDVAADGWRWLSTSWLLPGLVTPCPERADRPAPPVADRLCHSLDALGSSRALPEYRSAAMQLAAAIRRRFTVASLGVVGA